MIEYNTIRSGDIIEPDAHLKALIRAKYGEYASKTYYVLDRGTLQGRTVKHKKIVQITLDDGTELPPKVEEWEEHQWAKPLLLTQGWCGQNKKASLDWEEIRKFQPSQEQIEASSPRTKRTVGKKLTERKPKCEVSEVDKRAFLELAKKLGLSVEDINI